MTHPYDIKYGKSCCKDFLNHKIIGPVDFTYKGIKYTDYIRNVCHDCGQSWITRKHLLGID